MQRNIQILFVGLPVEEIEKMAKENPFLKEIVNLDVFWQDLLWIVYNVLPRYTLCVYERSYRLPTITKR